MSAITIIVSFRAAEASCGIGFFYFNGPFSQGCLACPADCDECNVPDIWAPVTSCTKCRPSFQRLSTGACAACPTHCTTCRRISATYDACLTCVNGYRLVGDRCQLICPTNCQTCSGVPNWFLTCSQCETGYAFDSQGTSCVQCDSNCRACTNYFRQCTTCEAGFYRDPNPPYARCLACDTCAPGEFERSACTTLNARWCVACRRQEVVIDNRCVACSVGTYTSDDRLSCQPCSVCTAPTHFRANGGECTTTQNTVCTPCADNKAATRDDQAVCDTCTAGFFRRASGSTFVCARCSDNPCDANQYISCANAVRQCLTCPGVTTGTACARGMEPSKTCDGRSTEPSVCQNCGAGSERPAGSISLICERCRMGFFKTIQSSDDCGRCTNAPASDATYLGWGNTVPNTANCPWYGLRCLDQLREVADVRA